MKTIAVIILEQFADWEVALLAPVLQQYVGYSVRYASLDKREKTSMGNLRVLPDFTLMKSLPMPPR